MKNSYLFLALLAFMCQPISTKAQCAGGRFQNQVFSSFTLDSVVYSTPYSLKMDIYRPLGDTMLRRPLIILAHEGGFFNGDRQYDLTVDSLCVRFAKRGYVTASIDYRLTTLVNMISPDSTLAMDAVVKAISDGKAAIRYFMKDASTVNSWKIDTNNIFVGGNSAGGVLFMNLAYVTAPSEVPPILDSAYAHNGGFNGNSSDASAAGYGIRIKGVINMAGALYRTSFVNAGDVSSVNFQGDMDDIVPYTCDWALGGMSWIKLCGLGSIQPEYASKGIYHMSKVFPGAGHLPWDTVASSFKTVDSLTTTFLYSKVCPAISQTSMVGVQPELTVYPNPAHEEVIFSAQHPMSTVHIFDATGRCLAVHSASHKASVHINTSMLPAGFYSAKIYFDNQNSLPVMRRFVLQ